MKTRTIFALSRVTDYHPSAARQDLARKSSHQSGTAVIVVLIILAILMIYVAGNVRMLNHLGRELKLLDEKQKQRWESASKTNVNAVIR